MRLWCLLLIGCASVPATAPRDAQPAATSENVEERLVAFADANRDREEAAQALLRASVLAHDRDALQREHELLDRVITSYPSSREASWARLELARQSIESGSPENARELLFALLCPNGGDLSGCQPRDAMPGTIGRAWFFLGEIFFDEGGDDLAPASLAYH